MTQPLPLITNDELTRLPAREPSGFGGLETARGHLPLAAMDVRARIEGLVASVDLRQTFVNTTGEPIEATYVFPLPDRAAVTRFRMKVGDRVIDGVLKERGQARQDYDQAIAAGKRAAITEEERSGVFTMRVGNLMPGDRAEVSLELTGPLPIADGDATFQFPLVVAPRYIPGTPLGGDDVGLGTASDTDAVPDASRITPPVLLPGYPNPVRLSLRVDVDAAGMPLSNLRSSLHAVATTGDGDHRRVEVSCGERLDRDFILRFHLGGEAMATGLVVEPDAEGPESTFMLTLVPSDREAAAQKPRDVVFVLDRSGSMDGWKMVAARRAVARMVDTLTDADRFAVYAFDDRIDTPSGLPGADLAPATDRNRFRAVEFLASLEARGGTEMAAPLGMAADHLTGGYQERDRVLVLATDGQVGNEDQILRALAPRLKSVRVFTIGIDQAVNAGFLRRLALAGGGACEVVESEDRLDEVMDRIGRRVSTPVITELAIAEATRGGFDVIADSIVPRRVPDLMAGAPVVVYGRCRGNGGAGLAVSGVDAIGNPWREVVPATAGQGRALAPLWARARVRELEDAYVIGRGDRAGLERQIVDTSLRFSVLSRFTAFVAVDDSDAPNPGGELREVVQPVEAPRGWAMLGAGGPPMPMAAAAPAGPPPAMQVMKSMAADAFDGLEEADDEMAAPPMAEKKGGLVSRALGGLRDGRAKRKALAPRRRPSAPAGAGRKRQSAASLPTDDLSGFRDRLERIIAALVAATAPEALAAAIYAAVRDLKAAAEDVGSLGHGDLADRLREIADELKRALAAGDDATLQRERDRAIPALRQVTDGTAPRSGQAFWK